VKEELPSKSSLVQWLLGIFQVRDAARIERTVATLRYLLEAGDANRVEEVLQVYAESLVTLTREGWRMLSARYPTEQCSVQSVGYTPRPMADLDSARSSYCGLGCTPRQVVQQTSARSSCCHVGYGKRGSTGSSRSWSDTQSTDLGTSRSSITWSDTTSAFGRLVQVVDADDEDDDVCQAFPDGLDDWDLRHTPNIHDHRDDWELQYILNSVLEEVRIQLEASNTHLIEQVLENARVRICTWTVHRWCIINAESD